MTSLTRMLQGTPYVAYSYAYPHKPAYRPLAPPVSLHTLWADEDKDALFLYLHIPFCEMRCGFCNLFTSANPQPAFASAYLRVPPDPRSAAACPAPRTRAIPWRAATRTPPPHSARRSARSPAATSGSSRRIPTSN